MKFLAFRKCFHWKFKKDWKMSYFLSAEASSWNKNSSLGSVNSASTMLASASKKLRMWLSLGNGCTDYENNIFNEL